jgi:hypothetical protein
MSRVPEKSGPGVNGKRDVKKGEIAVKRGETTDKKEFFRFKREEGRYHFFLYPILCVLDQGHRATSSHSHSYTCPINSVETV